MLTLEKVLITRDAFALEADFAVREGAHVAVLGPSGAGKSTLLAAIAGFQPPSAGRIIWRGEDLGALPPAARPVSLLFQDNNLFGHLSVEQNVGLGLRPSLRLRADERARVAEALARVGLEDLARRKPGQLSGGQAARAALARALVMDRPLILLDEPFGALGPALKADMLALVRELATEKGATLMMVTHEPADAAALGGEIIVVANGKAQAPAPASEILRSPPPELRDYLGR